MRTPLKTEFGLAAGAAAARPGSNVQAARVAALPRNARRVVIGLEVMVIVLPEFFGPLVFTRKGRLNAKA